jgi:uncharacterized YccA/Bax inhibitor family protein
MQETTSWNDTQKLLAFVVVAAFIVVIFVWMLHPPSTDSAATAVLNTLVGTLGGFAGMVVTFYFGSSRTSATKDQTIAALTANPSPGGNGHSQPSPTPAAPA